jgi:hypothetical protein
MLFMPRLCNSTTWLEIWVVDIWLWRLWVALRFCVVEYGWSLTWFVGMRAEANILGVGRNVLLWAEVLQVRVDSPFVHVMRMSFAIGSTVTYQPIAVGFYVE